MVTVILAVVLLVIGLSGTILPIDPVNDLLRQVGFRLTRDVAEVALVASPALLIAGSLVRGL